MPTAEIAETGEHILVTADYVDRDLLQSVPGLNWHAKSGRWRMPVSWPACLILRHTFGERLTVGPRLAEASWNWKALADTRRWLRARATRPGAEDPGWLSELAATVAGFAEATAHDGKRLYEFQELGTLWASLYPYGLLADEQGCGKTAQIASTMRFLRAKGADAYPALVICPPSVKGTWKREIAAWAPELTVSVVTGSAAQRRKALTRPADVFVINWETVRMHSRLASYGTIALRRCVKCGGETDPKTHEPLVKDSQCECHPRELNLIPFRTVVMDEAHRLANPRSKQTRATWWLAWSATYRYALTGTPVEKGIQDLWNILHALDPAAFPTGSAFVSLFASTARTLYGFEVLGIRPEMQQLFQDVTEPYVRRMLKAQVLPQLPPVVTQYRYPEMSSAQRKPYEQMRDDMIAHLDDLLVAPNAAAQLMILRQLASATATTVTEKDEEGNVHVRIDKLQDPSCKVDDLVDFLADEDPREQVVVASESRKLVELAASRLAKEGISYLMMTGETPQYERDAVVAAFQAGQARCFLMTIAVGGEGITLTAAPVIYFIQRHRSRRKNEQTKDRVHRIGSEEHESIRVVISVVKDTVDERVEELLAEKDLRVEDVVHDKERLRWLLTG